MKPSHWLLMTLLWPSVTGCHLLTRLSGTGYDFEIPHGGEPVLSAKKPASFYLGVDPGGYRYWRLKATSPEGETHRYSGRIWSDGGPIIDFESSNIAEAAARADGTTIAFDFEAPGKMSSSAAARFAWRSDKEKCFHFDLRVDGKTVSPAQVMIATNEINPGQVPFRACFNK